MNPSSSSPNSAVNRSMEITPPVNTTVRRFVALGIIVIVVGLVASAVGVVAFRESPPKHVWNAKVSTKPFQQAVAATGIVEPATGIVELRPPVSGVVANVYVKTGQRVREGEPLVALDSRHLASELAIREAQLREARLSWQKLSGSARVEEVSVAQARVLEARARADEAARLVANAEALTKQGAIAQEMLLSRQRQSTVSQAQLTQALATEQIALKQGGGMDVAIASARVQAAEAAVAATKIEMERHIVRAPFDGDVLKVEVREGSFLESRSADRLIAFGDLSTLIAVADIDEYDLSRFDSSQPAKVSARGNSSATANAKFLGRDRLVVAQSSLGGRTSERFDVRVLKAKFQLLGDMGAFVPGQLVDIYVQSGQAGAVANAGTGRPD